MTRRGRCSSSTRLQTCSSPSRTEPIEKLQKATRLLFSRRSRPYVRAGPWCRCAHASSRDSADTPKTGSNRFGFEAAPRPLDQLDQVSHDCLLFTLRLT